MSYNFSILTNNFSWVNQTTKVFDINSMFASSVDRALIVMGIGFIVMSLGYFIARKSNKVSDDNCRAIENTGGLLVLMGYLFMLYLRYMT